MSASEAELAAFAAANNCPPDVSVEIESYKWLVHGNIMARRSAFFKRACKVCLGDSKPSSIAKDINQESSERIIKLQDDCPWIIARILIWCYTNDDNHLVSDHDQLRQMMWKSERLPKHEELEAGNRDLWQKYAMLYRVADKYGIPDLLKVARGSLPTYLKANPSLMEDVFHFIGLGTLHNDPVLYESLLYGVFEGSPSVPAVLEELRVLFGNDRDLLDTAHSILAVVFDSRGSLLKKVEQRDTDVFGSITTARDCIARVDNEMAEDKHRSSKVWQKKLREADTVLCNVVENLYVTQESKSMPRRRMFDD